MANKRPGAPASREAVVRNLHEAVRSYIASYGGNASRIGPINIVAHKALSYDVVIHCVGRRPAEILD